MLIIPASKPLKIINAVIICVFFFSIQILTYSNYLSELTASKNSNRLLDSGG